MVQLNGSVQSSNLPNSPEVRRARVRKSRWRPFATLGDCGVRCVGKQQLWHSVESIADHIQEEEVAKLNATGSVDDLLQGAAATEDYGFSSLQLDQGKGPSDNWILKGMQVKQSKYPLTIGRNCDRYSGGIHSSHANFNRLSSRCYSDSCLDEQDFSTSPPPVRTSTPKLRYPVTPFPVEPLEHSEDISPPQFFTPKILKTEEGRPLPHRSSPFLTIHAVPKREAIVIPFSGAETDRQLQLQPRIFSSTHTEQRPPPKPPRLFMPLSIDSSAIEAARNAPLLLNQYPPLSSDDRNSSVTYVEPFPQKFSSLKMSEGRLANSTNHEDWCSTVYSRCYQEGPIAHSTENSRLLPCGPSSLPIPSSQREMTQQYKREFRHQKENINADTNCLLPLQYKRKTSIRRSARVQKRPSIDRLKGKILCREPQAPVSNLLKQIQNGHCLNDIDKREVDSSVNTNRISSSYGQTKECHVTHSCHDSVPSFIPPKDLAVDVISTDTILQNDSVFSSESRHSKPPKSSMKRNKVLRKRSKLSFRKLLLQSHEEGSKPLLVRTRATASASFTVRTSKRVEPPSVGTAEEFQPLYSNRWGCSFSNAEMTKFLLSNIHNKTNSPHTSASITQKQSLCAKILSSVEPNGNSIKSCLNPPHGIGKPPNLHDPACPSTTAHRTINAIENPPVPAVSPSSRIKANKRLPPQSTHSKPIYDEFSEAEVFRAAPVHIVTSSDASSNSLPSPSVRLTLPLTERSLLSNGGHEKHSKGRTSDFPDKRTRGVVARDDSVKDCIGSRANDTYPYCRDKYKASVNCDSDGYAASDNDDRPSNSSDSTSDSCSFNR